MNMVGMGGSCFLFIYVPFFSMPIICKPREVNGGGIEPNPCRERPSTSHPGDELLDNPKEISSKGTGNG
jgi:hypothetical protein